MGAGASSSAAPAQSLEALAAADGLISRADARELVDRHGVAWREEFGDAFSDASDGLLPLRALVSQFPEIAGVTKTTFSGAEGASVGQSASVQRGSGSATATPAKEASAAATAGGGGDAEEWLLERGQFQKHVAGASPCNGVVH